MVNTLNIQGVDENTPLEVYNLTGKSVLKDKGTELDVTSLSQGTYILRINNQYVKFIKK
ncbi:MAG: T9SS type A sorting domain-containing protein [Paludibacteraceae bacterium]|nr:T9SS type A sorting domain-containing protein [Paludibacteraceae bacterium]